MIKNGIQKAVVVAFQVKNENAFFGPLCGGAGKKEVAHRDAWAIVTCDGKLAAHWEHTVAVTEAGPMILTLPPPSGTSAARQ